MASGHSDGVARLSSIVLAADDVAAQRRFYGEALGLPVTASLGRAQRVFPLREMGLQAYGTAQPTFVPLGDERGLLILVERGRHWFPTTTPALSEPMEVEIRSPAAGAEDVVVGSACLRLR